MVMTRPPALHVCKFLMKNMIPTNSGLKKKWYGYARLAIVIGSIVHVHFCALRLIKFSNKTHSCATVLS